MHSTAKPTRPLAVAQAAGAPVFAVGNFIMAIINFLIVAFVVFMLVKMVNRIKEASERKAARVEAKEEEQKGPDRARGPARDPRRAQEGLIRQAQGGRFSETENADFSRNPSRKTRVFRPPQAFATRAGDTTSMPSALPTA